MWSRVYETVERSHGVRRVCCQEPCRQEISTDSGGCHTPSGSRAAARRSAANASSVTLTADVYYVAVMELYNETQFHKDTDIWH